MRYVDQTSDAKNKTNDKGFFARMFSSSDDKNKSAQRYRVTVKGAGNVSQVTVQGADGKADTSATSERILTLLSEQLK